MSVLQGELHEKRKLSRLGVLHPVYQRAARRDNNPELGTEVGSGDQHQKPRAFTDLVALNMRW